jgi:hypothetical protein
MLSPTAERTALNFRRVRAQASKTQQRRAAGHRLACWPAGQPAGQPACQPAIQPVSLSRSNAVHSIQPTAHSNPPTMTSLGTHQRITCCCSWGPSDLAPSRSPAMDGCGPSKGCDGRQLPLLDRGMFATALRSAFLLALISRASNCAKCAASRAACAWRMSCRPLHALVRVTLAEGGSDAQMTALLADGAKAPSGRGRGTGLGGDGQLASCL